MKDGMVLTGGFPYKGTHSEQLRFVLAYGAASVPPAQAQPWAFRLNDPCIEIRLEHPASGDELRAGAFWAGAATFGIEVAMQCYLLGPELELSPDPADPGLLARLEATFVSLPSRQDLALLSELERPALRSFETNREVVSIAEWQLVQEAAGHEHARLTPLPGVDLDNGASQIALSTRGDTVLDWLRAGRAFTRVWLAGRAAGLVVHPSTTIPVTPELRLQLTEIQDVIGVTQAILKIGHPVAIEAPQRPTHNNASVS